MSSKKLVVGIVCVAVIAIAGVLIARQMGAFEPSGGKGGPSAPTGPRFARLELKCPDCGSVMVRKIAMLEGAVAIDPASGKLVCPKCRKPGAGVVCRSCGKVADTVRVDQAEAEVYCGLCNKPVAGSPDD